VEFETTKQFFLFGKCRPGGKHAWAGFPLPMILLKQIDPAKIKSFAARMAGKAGRGAVKARSPEQARRAALARWGTKNE
jgi:hypothetical protein